MSANFGTGVPSSAFAVRSSGNRRSIFVSTTATTTPRPSNVGCAATNWAAPIAPLGKYGFIAGVSRSGGRISVAALLGVHLTQIVDAAREVHRFKSLRHRKLLNVVCRYLYAQVIDIVVSILHHA